MNRLLWSASLTCALVACSVNLIEPEGRACDGDHPCAPGLSCQGGTCVIDENVGGDDDAGTGSDGGVHDDAGMNTDAGEDTDGGVDAGEEDAGFDAGTDAGTDAGVDAGMDAGTDAGMDGGTDAGYPPNTFFVDPAGDDTLDGRTPATAWRTVAKVSSAALPTGSWVLFKGGGVWNESLAPIKNGVDGDPILFGGYGTGRPVLDGTGSSGNSALNANGKSWVIFRDFELRGWHGGFQLIYMANTHHVRFENLYMHDADKGFHASPSAPSTDITISGCVVQDISGGTFTHGASTPAGGTGWVVEDSEFSHIEQSCFIDAATGTQFLRNTFFDCGKITANSDRHGLFLRGPDTVVVDNEVKDIAGACLFSTYEGATFEGNLLHDCGTGGIEWSETSTVAGTLRARRNLIWDVPTGITIGASSAQGFALSNNSIHTVRQSGAAAAAGIVVKANTDVALENNLVTGSAATVLSVSRPAPVGTFVDRTNVWHTTSSTGTPISWNGTSMSLAQYKTASGQNTSTDVDPVISSTAPGMPDFALSTATPVRDFGVTNPATGTLTPGCDGAPNHYCGAAPEPGAFELLSP